MNLLYSKNNRIGLAVPKRLEGNVDGSGKASVLWLASSGSDFTVNQLLKNPSQ